MLIFLGVVIVLVVVAVVVIVAIVVVFINFETVFETFLSCVEPDRICLNYYRPKSRAGVLSVFILNGKLLKLIFRFEFKISKN